MRGKREETIIVSIAAVLLIGIFGTIAYFDRPYSDIGEDYGLEDVDISIGRTEGNVVSPDIPEGLYMFRSGANASMDFTVTNNDPDNDIDTIVVTVPGSTMTGSNYEWSEPEEEHQWGHEVSGDHISFTAETDFARPGTGGSAQYDTAGGEDDALDHDSDLNISEGITISVSFTAPAGPGLRAGSEAIRVEVGDLRTEASEPLTSFAPFPYPYWTYENGSSYIIMVLEGASVDLEVVYGNTTQFGSSRATGFLTFDHGMKFIDARGRSVAVIEEPSDGTVVKPVVRALSTVSTGQFTIDVFVLELGAASADPIRVPIVTGYYEEIPEGAGAALDLDMDSDGTYNDLDMDADGDGQNRTIDRDDRDRDVMEFAPEGLEASVDRASVEVGGAFVLSAHATDANGDPVTFTWTVDGVPGWSARGPSVIVKAEGEFDPGRSYRFTVTADDGHSDSRPTDTVLVTIEEEGKVALWIVIVVAIVIIVAIACFLFIYRMRDGRREGAEGKVADVHAADRPDTIEGPGVTASAPEGSPAVPIRTEAQGDQGAVGPTGMVAERHEDIREFEEIEELEALAEGLDVAETCPECGATLGPNDMKCNRCGAEFEIEIECPACKARLDPADLRCPGCGIEFVS